jgi:hypothetical protein
MESEQQQKQEKELEEVVKSLPSDVVNDLFSRGVITSLLLLLRFFLIN